MKRPLPALDVNLHIEQGGHEMKFSGSGNCYLATFPTLLSLLHFLRVSWQYRKRIPRAASLHLEWRRIRIPVKSQGEPTPIE